MTKQDKIPFADKVQQLPIRDQIAMAALATINYEHYKDAREVARIVYKLADAMLEARAR
jgi:hypothetical protein